jgi:hypothetical protein
VAAIASAALWQPAAAQQAPSPPPAPIGAAAREQAHLNKSISTMDGFGALGDGMQFTMVACFTNNAAFCGGQAFNVVSFPSPQNGTLATTLSGSPGGGTLTAGSAFCRSEMAGAPIYIPGAGPNSSGLLSRITECIGSQPSAKFAIALPVAQVPPGTVTIAYGAMALNNGQGWQQSLDAGKGIFVGSSGNTGGLGATYTIAAVNSPTSITLSGNVSSISNNGAESFVWGHDDSAAVTAACNAVLASGLRDLQVPAQHYTPTLSEACYGVKLHGNGAILAANQGMPNGTAVSTVQELVVPENAPWPAPPPRSVIAARDLTQCRLAGPNPVIVQTGDSLETLLPSQLSSLGSYPGTFQAAFRNQNRAIAPIFHNGGVGAAQMVNFDGNPNGIGGDIITSTSAPWLSQVAAVTPCGVTIGFGNNDGVGLNLPALVDSYLKLSGAGSIFAMPPDIIYVTHHPYTRINGNFSSGNALPSEGGAYAAGYICSFAHLLGRPCIDGEREGEKHLFGYDPGAMAFTRRYDVPYNTISSGLPFNYPFFVNGFSAQFQKSGQNAATFWNNFTGNGGLSDPRGPMIVFQIGFNGDNLLWLFYNSATNQIGYECDPSAGLPGFGCSGPNGQPPVTPFGLLSNITVASSGGNTVVTSSAPIFGSCVAGETVTVPGAGPTETPPGFFSYTAPLIATVAAGGCNSATQITLNGAPGNTYTSQLNFVFAGNPVTWSNVTDASNCTNEPFQVEVNFDQARIWFCNPYQVVYAGTIMRARNKFQPRIFSGGSRPSITVGADSNGGTTFQVTEPFPTQVTYTDDQVSGPASGAPLNNTAYSGVQGGDGNNHNPQGFGARVIQTLMDAQDLSLGLSQGLYTNAPASGFSLTIPNGYGTVLLTPAATLASGALTLPQTYPQNQDLVIGSTQTVTALTLNANSGQSINGAPTTLAANTSVKFRLEGATWYRLQ